MSRSDDATTGAIVLGLGLGVATLAGAMLLQATDRKELDNMKPSILGPVWPIALTNLRRVGETIADRRIGSGRRHYGVDLFADAGTPVIASSYGRILHIIDGRKADRSKQEALFRAGLFIDILLLNGRIDRYLHLGSVSVREGQPVRAGYPIATISAAGESGIEHSDPHLHFEIRESWDPIAHQYGEPLDPLKVLPPLRKVA